MELEFVTALEPRRLFAVTAHIRLLNSEDVIEAGQSVHVNSLTTRSGKGTNFGAGDAITSHIVWNFGDAHGAYNRLVGFNAAHVYDTPGTYKLTLRVTNKLGEIDTAARIITVKPSTRRAIYLSPWGNDKSNGRTQGKAVQSLARAEQLLGDNTALYIRAGTTYTTKKAILLPFSNVQVDSYGKGKAPKIILKSSGNQFAPIFSTTAVSHHVTIENMLLEARGGSPFGNGVDVAGTSIVVRGCGFENLDSAIMTADDTTGLVASGDHAGTLKSYFAYVKGTDQVYLDNVAGDSTDQHNIRIYGSRILCWGNDLTNLAEGSSLATLRVNDGGYIYWANNTLHGGQMYVGPLTPASAGSTADEFVYDVVIENNRWQEVPKHWSSNDRLDINAGVSNVMVRNNFIDSTNSTAISASTFAHEKFSTGPIDRTIKNLQILDNTVINSGTTGSFLTVGGSTTNVVTLKNSLYVAPKLDIGPNAAAAVRVNSRNDLLNFTKLSSGGGIDGNVWNLPAAAKSEGVNYVSAVPAGNSAYRTPEEWEADFPKEVGHDTFLPLLTGDLSAAGAPLADTKAAAVAPAAAGVFTDLIGNPRPDGKWTAGALQSAV